MINLDNAYCTAIKDGVKCPLAENCSRAIRHRDMFFDYLIIGYVSIYDPAPFIDDTCEIFVENVREKS